MPPNARIKKPISDQPEQEQCECKWYSLERGGCPAAGRRRRACHVRPQISTNQKVTLFLSPLEGEIKHSIIGRALCHHTPPSPTLSAHPVVSAAAQVSNELCIATTGGKGLHHTNTRSVTVSNRLGCISSIYIKAYCCQKKNNEPAAFERTRESVRGTWREQHYS